MKIPTTQMLPKRDRDKLERALCTIVDYEGDIVTVYQDGSRWRYHFTVEIFKKPVTVEGGPDCKPYYFRGPQFSHSEGGAFDMGVAHRYAIVHGKRSGHLWQTEWRHRGTSFGTEREAYCECGNWIALHPDNWRDLACGSCRYQVRKGKPSPLTTDKIQTARSFVRKHPHATNRAVLEAVREAYSSGVGWSTIRTAVEDERKCWLRTSSPASNAARRAASEDPELDRAMERFARDHQQRFPGVKLTTANAARVLLRKALAAEGRL